MIRGAYFTYTRGTLVLPPHLLELKEACAVRATELSAWEPRRPPARHVMQVLMPWLESVGYAAGAPTPDQQWHLPGLGDAELAISFSAWTPERRTALHVMGRSAWERREFLHQTLAAALHPQIDYLALAVLNWHEPARLDHFEAICNYLKVLYSDPSKFRLPLSGLLILGYGPPKPEAD